MEDKISLILDERVSEYGSIPAFFICVSKNFVLQNCYAPENELFFRKNVPEKSSNTGVLQALRVHYGGKRAVSQAFYPYRGSDK